METTKYKAGEIILEKGDTDRDLFFLSQGVVEFTTEELSGDFVLNEMEPPQIFGDIGFFYGLPRTATAKAKTDVEVFVLRFKPLKDQYKEIPGWLKPILSQLSSRIKAREVKIKELEQELLELKKKFNVS